MALTAAAAARDWRVDARAWAAGTAFSWRVVNLWLTLAWVLAVPLAVLTGWVYSVAFVSAISIYANAASHLAAHRADVPNG